MSPPGDAERDVQMHWGVKILLRDGVRLNGTLYLPKSQERPSPTVLTLSPYIGQHYHDRGFNFAAHGFPFLAVDVRGRGNSEGKFRPLIQEARDGFDVVEWLAQQPYCNGQVAMSGGSYCGYDQWATAKEFPPHLATIVPLASAYIGIDHPLRNNIFVPYVMQWLTFVTGRTSQEKIFSDQLFWRSVFRRWFEAGSAFKELDRLVGNPSEIFQEYLTHPEQDEYWSSYNPTAQQYAGISIPILTITGIYDPDQPGALTHYREHLNNCSADARGRHYLVIGPWDHAGTRTPKAEFLGLKVGPASLIDVSELERQWYTWVMQDGPKPAFLQKNVAYYVTGAEKWRYADSLAAVTARSESLYLHSACNPVDVFKSGELSRTLPTGGEPDHYVYDPRDVSLAAIECQVDPQNLVDQRMLHASLGKQLIYHSAPFEQDVEITGFFRLSVWLSIDQPDTDFRVSVYEVNLDGGVLLLTADWMRARYRQTLCAASLVTTEAPLRYDFERFTFTSRQIRKGNRLRLAIGPINSIYSQKSYNSGGVVAEETMLDARVVTVRLFHDEAHPSVLHVPLGQPDDRPLTV